MRAPVTTFLRLLRISHPSILTGSGLLPETTAKVGLSADHRGLPCTPSPRGEDGNPPSSGQNLNTLALLYYPEIYDCVWTDSSVCHFPGYRAKDNWVGGAWVQSTAGNAILMLGVKGLGRAATAPKPNVAGIPAICIRGIMPILMSHKSSSMTRKI